ncbi:MAG: hypothetical protein JKX76_00525, partial [Colwellia sp.]|nr:hypothetical protein [Colwellia sp.]
MSLAPSLRYTLHQPVVVTSDFLVKFPLFSTDDLQVYVEGVQISLFTVTATFVGGRSTDAEINLLTGVSGIDVEIYGARSPRRDSDYLGNSPKLAINLQNDTDQLTAVQQEQARDFATAFKVSPQSPLLSPMSGDAASRSGRVPAFNKDGTGLEIGPNIDEISNAQSYAQSALKGASRAEAAADRATEKDIASYNLLSANSATVNDAALSGLVAAPLAPFDLNGLVYRVSSVPTSPRFQNGGWEIAGTPNAGTPNTVFPAEKTLALRRQQVSRGEFQYEIGSQGAVSTRGRGEDISVVSVVHKGPGHYSAETRPHLFARGRDEAGFRDEGAIALPSSVSEAISCFALGCFGNAMFAGVRASGGASETDKIYYRRVAEKRFNQSITFSTTNGSATVSAQLAAGKHWDVRPGDHVRISDVGASINNVVINALANNDLGYPVVTHDPSTRTITFVATNFDIGFAAEASGSVTLTTPEVEFRETAWAPILTVETGTNYTLLHGLELFVSGSDLIGQSGVHGAGATGCEFLRFTGLFASAALSGTTYTLGSEASETLVEPLALRLSTGAQIVSARTQ